MKKTWIIFPLLAYFLLPCTTAFGEEDEAGHVLTVKKDVRLLRAGQQTPARARDPLFLKDTVATGPNSRAKLFFRDDSVLNLGEQSRVSVDEYLYSSEKDRSRAVYNLLEGSLKAVVGRSDLEVHTPTAVAAARGTKFIVTLQGSGADLETLIMVLAGEVTARSIQKEILKVVTLRKGQMTRVPLGKPPIPPSQTPPHLLKQYRAGTLAIGEVFRDRRDRIPRPGTDGEKITSQSGEEGQAGGDPQGPRGSEKTPPVWEAMKNLGQPPIQQEPSRALGSGSTDVNVNVQFPEGR